MKNRNIIRSILFLSTVVFILTSCTSTKVKELKKIYYSENELIHSSEYQDSNFLKAHDYDGNVYIFHSGWKLDTSTHTLSGSASAYNANRDLYRKGHVTIHTDSIVLFESNRILPDQTAELIAPKLIITGLNAALLGFCISYPKACYGSCPTFYTEHTDHVFETVAESFSNAISPSLRYKDIDDIHVRKQGGQVFHLTMKNEALETHYVEEADIIAVPVINTDHMVLHGHDDKFYTCKNPRSWNSVQTSYTMDPHVLLENDHQEWVVPSNQHDLASKGEIIFRFDQLENLNQETYGLQITFRQTLMTTYILYHALSYMGDEYSDILSMLENSGKIGDKTSRSILKSLGKIEIYTSFDQKNWTYAGSFHETGPIAKNTQVCPLLPKQNKFNENSLFVKMKFTEGLWKFDQVQLVNIVSENKPIFISPTQIQQVQSTEQYEMHQKENIVLPMTSMPGEQYKISYSLPSDQTEYQLFLSAKGYYLEWMRQEWLQDKNLRKLKKIMYNPEKWLREEAGTYKKYENQLESDFENSKIDAEKRKSLLSITLKN